MSKIYIAGCGGMLGEAFYRQFSEAGYILKCTDIDLNEEWLSFLDFRDYDSYRADVLEFSPDYLFHVGAYTSLEFCEDNVDDTYNTNTLSVENACHIANELDIPLVYISTAGIFDGNQASYDDWDVPNPLGHYARSKYLGEIAVQKMVKKHFIFRAGWMMGAGPKKDKKFIQKMMKQIQNGADVLHVVNDKDGTPTYTQDFAKTVMGVLQTPYTGLYNLVCDGATSRAEVLRELLFLVGKEESIKVEEVTSSFFEKEYFAARPASENLVNKKLIIRNMNKMRPWKVALKEYIEEYYKGYLD